MIEIVRNARNSTHVRFQIKRQLALILAQRRQVRIKGLQWNDDIAFEERHACEHGKD